MFARSRRKDPPLMPSCHQPESHDITQSQQSDPVFVRHIVCPEKRWFNRYGERFNVNHFGDCGRREKTSLPITFARKSFDDITAADGRRLLAERSG